ncbi:MAG: apolipoprotein N-acyltransferase [Planctomycetaceae bacterium]
MSTAMLMEKPKTVPRTRDPKIDQIIQQARTAPVTARGVWYASGLTAAALWATFTPLDFGPLAWVAAVPLLLLVRLKQVPRRMYLAAALCSWVATMAMLQWMRLGDTAMYFAWLALGTYISLYIPLFLAITRTAVHRLRVPLIAAAPLTYVGLEFVRSHLMTGFGWYSLGHSQYWWTALIQISDITGAYGVSFVVMLISAGIAGLVPFSVFQRFKISPPQLTTADEAIITTKRPGLQIAICLLVFGAVLGYGFIRRGQADFQPGPRAAMVQCNFVSSLKHDQRQYGDIFRKHEQLTGVAVQHQPDLIVWPETMFRWPLMQIEGDVSDQKLRTLAPYIPVERWHDSPVPEVLRNMSQMTGAALIIGVETYRATPEKFGRYNSAAFVRPDVGLMARYDKIHRVPFGEYVPLREQFPWLKQMTPIPDGASLEAGEGPVACDYQKWRFAPIVCFEDTVPHLVRGIVHDLDRTSDPMGKPRSVDVLVNITNDGWFHGSSELDQHLITAAFRAVECRTPMVRAVNTGISAVIDGDGVILEPEVFIDGDGQGRTTLAKPGWGRWHKSLNALVVAEVPLDSRTSLYVKYGDWFGSTCCFATVLFALGALIVRKRR